MKKGKAPAEDGIPIDFFKNLPRIGKTELTCILNGLWQRGEMIKGWETARIFPIHKGGSEMDTSNYRGIALLDTG